jgi:tetratricopeptide (TPR) repeat protein
VLPGVFNYINEKPKTEGRLFSEVELVKKMKLKADIIEQRQIESGKPITIAATTIGALSYFTNANVIDMLGLTDGFISHNPQEIPAISGTSDIGWKERKYNADYVLKRKPDHIIFSTGAKPSAYAERALFTKAEFFQKYYPEQILVPEAGTSIIIYSRKDKFPDEPQDTLKSTEKINYTFIDHYVSASSLLTLFENSKDPVTGKKLVKECNETNKLCPSFFSDGYRILGRYYLLVNDLEKSKDNLLRSIQIDNMNSIAHSGLAVVYAKEQNMPSANYHYLKAIKFSPGLLIK